MFTDSGYTLRAVTTRPGWTPNATRRASLAARAHGLRIRNNADTDTATMWVYDEISWCGVPAEAFAKELAGVTASTIEVRLNSPGGDLFDGIAIHNSLRGHPAVVNVVVDGLAASVASVIAMAGDTVRMNAGTQMMIHDGLALCIGNSADMIETAGLLEKCSDQIAGFYARRAGGTVADWRTRMRAETWYTPEEAVAAGLADSVDPAADLDSDPLRVAARFDLSIFNYAGRDAAPAPTTRPAPPPPQLRPPEDVDIAVFRSALAAALSPPTALFDPDMFRTAMTRRQGI